jgi:hypothetical protein
MDEVVLKNQEKSQLSIKTYRFIAKSIAQKAQIKTHDSHVVFYDVSHYTESHYGQKPV